MTIRKHLFISGKVQGVTFRASTKRRARKIGVDGWVKNLSDGRVEIVVEGREEDVERLVGWCHTGPRLANIEKVEQKGEEPEGLEGFNIRH